MRRTWTVTRFTVHRGTGSHIAIPKQPVCSEICRRLRMAFDTCRVASTAWGGFRWRSTGPGDRQAREADQTKGQDLDPLQHGFPRTATGVLGRPGLFAITRARRVPKEAQCREPWQTLVAQGIPAVQRGLQTRWVG